MTVKIYHNPRCSKSRQTLALLADHGIEPEIIEYLKTPPTKTELARILSMLGIGARALMRKKEAEYIAEGLDDAALEDAALIAAMVAHPILIERPIVVSKTKAVIGRPPENALDIL
jgi:arsenate reductase